VFTVVVQIAFCFIILISKLCRTFNFPENKGEKRRKEKDLLEDGEINSL
jgi:hypothetical protein